MERTEDSQLTPEAHRAANTVSHRRYLLSATLAIAAGAALRFWLLYALYEVGGDALVYGGIAKNLLLHRWYALTTGAGITYSTLIRLPGYPLFVELCFRLFGLENYFAVGCVQIVAELGGCLLLAVAARRIAAHLRIGADPGFVRRAELATLWIAALCPFTASYAGKAITEALTLLMIAAAIWAMGRFCDRPGWAFALTFTLAVTYAALLRPDGALVAIALAPVMLIGLRRSRSPRSRQICMATVCILLTLTPFAFWGARNWKVFHVFQPLAPRLATDPDERTNPGWERWIKSWCLDFTCTEQVYWAVPGDAFDVTVLPNRAFDNPAQYQQTAALARDYNEHGKKLSPDLDARFGRIADARIHNHPLRYYLWLPVGRMVDMWLRPRNENLMLALYWWDFPRHPGQTLFNLGYAALNAAYLLLALFGLWLRPRFWKSLLFYIFLRCCLLLTVQAPEARYTLECFPIIFVLGGVALAHFSGPRRATPSRQRA